MSAPPLDLGLLRSEIAELWAEVLRLKARVAELEGGRPAPSESLSFVFGGRGPA